MVEAFVAGGAVQAFGPRLHIDEDCLALDGWWKAAFRISAHTFAVRQEPPEATTVVDDVATQLRGRGLQEVPANVALLVAVTYTAIDLGPDEWTIWSTDLSTAEADLAARAGVESFLGDSSPLGGPLAQGTGQPDLTAGMGGMRRTAGLAPLVVLTVGIDEASVRTLAGALDDCHVEARDMGDISADDCGSLTPNLAVVDTTSAVGERFAIQLRATPYGRFLPLVVLTAGDPPSAADVALDPGQDPTEWADHIRRLLP